MVIILTLLMLMVINNGDDNTKMTFARGNTVLHEVCHKRYYHGTLTLGKHTVPVQLHLDYYSNDNTQHE